MPSVTRFALWFGLLSALVALFLQADERGLEWAFWGVLAGALTLTLFPAVRRFGKRAFIALRAHDRLLRQVADLSAELETEQRTRKDLETELTTAHETGIEEGIMQVLGSLLASVAEIPPALVGIGEISGSLVLVARYESGEEVPVGARYELQFESTGDSKGFVQVEHVDEAKRRAYLVSVERRSPAFWDHLEQRVAIDQSPPPGCVLVPYAYESPLGYDPISEIMFPASEGE